MTTPQQRPGAAFDEAPREHHTCPFWVGYLLASPLRKLGENPEKILAPVVAPGMTVVDVGCAMGFYSLPLARMVGDQGRVVCVDIQERMLKNLEKRARRRKLDHIIEARKSTQEDLCLGDLEGTVDLALAANVAHETAYPRRFLTQIHESLRPEGKLLLLEPRGHVSEQAFDATRRLAQDVGFSEIEHKQLMRSKILILQNSSV